MVAHNAGLASVALYNVRCTMLGGAKIRINRNARCVDYVAEYVAEYVADMYAYYVAKDVDYVAREIHYKVRNVEYAAKRVDYEPTHAD